MKFFDKVQQFVLGLTLLIHLVIVCGWTIRVAYDHAVSKPPSSEQK